jgi:hypothetical protein
MKLTWLDLALHSLVLLIRYQDVLIHEPLLNKLSQVRFIELYLMLFRTGKLIMYILQHLTMFEIFSLQRR